MVRRLFFRKIRGAEKFWLVTKNAALRRARFRYEKPLRGAPFPINRPAGCFRHEKPSAQSR